MLGLPVRDRTRVLCSPHRSSVRGVHICRAKVEAVVIQGTRRTGLQRASTGRVGGRAWSFDMQKRVGWSVCTTKEDILLVGLNLVGPRIVGSLGRTSGSKGLGMHVDGNSVLKPEGGREVFLGLNVGKRWKTTVKDEV